MCPSKAFIACLAAVCLIASVTAQGCEVSEIDCKLPDTYCNGGQCVPTLLFNKTCTADTECRSTTCCVQSAEFPLCPATGACGSCVTDDQCSANLLFNVYCSNSGNPPQCLFGTIQSGGTCSKTTQCASGLFCTQANKCAPKLAKGASCINNNDCGKNLYCAKSTAGAGTCTDSVGLGKACSGIVLCLDFLSCNNQPGPTFQTCVPLLPDNSSPVNCNNDLDCSSSGFCSSNNFAPGPCVTRLATGAFCTRPRQCASGNCVNGACTPAATCTINSQCAFGKVCASGVCMDPLTLGSVCVSNDQCFSGLCNPTSTSGAVKYCQACSTLVGSPVNCATGSYCNTANGIGICFAKLPSGSVCSSGLQCISGVCTNGLCVGGCLTSANCPSGQLCVNGVCTANGGKVDGSSCLFNSECNSGLCYQGVCRAPCVPGLPGSICPNGFTCQSTGLVGGGACVPGLPVVPGLPDGCSCLFNSQCSSGICNCGVCGFQCFNNWQCPPGMFCSGGSCRANAILPIGAPCSVGPQCASGNCYCGFCCAQCWNDRQCPLGMFCNSITGSCTLALCPIGYPCFVGSECQSGVCFNGFCASRCFSSWDCPSGYICDSGTCRTGNCGPQNPCAPGYVCQNNQCVYIRLPDGSSCSSDNDCQSSICFNGGCAKRCLVNTDCQPGYNCNYGTGRCEWNRKPIGSVCSLNSECISNWCDPIALVCAQACTSSSCPVGYSCNPSTGACVLQLIPDYGRCVFDSECQSGICNVGYCGSCRSVGCQVQGYVCDSASGRCTLGLLPIGGTCQFASQCQSGFCNFGLCSSACTPNSCGSGFYCSNGACYAGCTRDSECGFNSYCLNFKCYVISSLPNGALCAFDNQCQSSWCCGGQCRSRVPIGGRCQSDFECISGVCDCSFTWSSWGVCAVGCTPFDAIGCPSGWFCGNNPSRWSQPCCVPNSCQWYPSYGFGKEQQAIADATFAVPLDAVEANQFSSLEASADALAAVLSA